MYFPCDKEVALILIKLTSQNSSISSSQLHLSSDRKKNIQSKLQVSPPGTDIAEGISTYADYCTKHFSIIFRLWFNFFVVIVAVVVTKVVQRKRASGFNLKYMNVNSSFTIREIWLIVINWYDEDRKLLALNVTWSQRTDLEKGFKMHLLKSLSEKGSIKVIYLYDPNLPSQADFHR